MPWAFIASTVGNLIGADMQSNAAQSAANTTAGAADRATQLQREMWQKQVEMQMPWFGVGRDALGELQKTYATAPAAFTGKVDLTQDPGYAFRLSEGQKALDRSAAARGGLISGGALKAAQRFGQDLGSQEYQNAYNRALTNYNANVARDATIYNRLSNMAGVGQTAATTLGNAGQTMASNVGNAYMGQAANQGNALLAGSQARASAYGDIAKAYGQTKPNFNNLFGSSGGSNPFASAGPDPWADIGW